jgi:hypothetical protein
MTENRKLFVVTFRVEGEGLPPLPEGQNHLLHVPAYLEDISTAGQKALEYADNFANTEEGKRYPGVKLKVQKIEAGGTLLT